MTSTIEKDEISSEVKELNHILGKDAEMIVEEMIGLTGTLKYLLIKIDNANENKTIHIKIHMGKNGQNILFLVYSNIDIILISFRKNNLKLKVINIYISHCSIKIHLIYLLFCIL